MWLGTVILGPTGDTVLETQHRLHPSNLFPEPASGTLETTDPDAACPHVPKYWDYKNAPPHLVSEELQKGARASLCTLGKHLTN